MKKIVTLLLTSACALAITSISFGMLTKTSLTRKIAMHKKVNFLHAIPEPECYSCTPANCLCKKKVLEIQQSISKKTNLNDSKEETHNLLHTIAKQNKENNELLRFIIKQNYEHFDYRFDHNPNSWSNKQYQQMYGLYNKLEKEYNIKIKNNE